MKVALLFSGGKDSTYAGYLARKHGYDLACLITIVSANKESYMFHTPSIEQVKKQAEVMNLPLIIKRTKGNKEYELLDLEKAIADAIKKYDIKAVITGAIGSVYQASRVQMICDRLKIECFNPLWQKNQIELLEELIKNKFEVAITGVFAYPLNEKWLGRKIDKKFIEDVSELQKKYKINPGGEGGEFETFVLNCSLFKHELKIADKKIFGEKNSWRLEVEVE